MTESSVEVTVSSVEEKKFTGLNLLNNWAAMESSPEHDSEYNFASSHNSFSPQHEIHTVILKGQAKRLSVAESCPDKQIPDEGDDTLRIKPHRVKQQSTSSNLE